MNIITIIITIIMIMIMIMDNYYRLKIIIILTQFLKIFNFLESFYFYFTLFLLFLPFSFLKQQFNCCNENLLNYSIFYVIIFMLIWNKLFYNIKKLFDYNKQIKRQICLIFAFKFKFLQILICYKLSKISPNLRIFL